jgi:hypothetical protein
VLWLVPRRPNLYRSSHVEATVQIAERFSGLPGLALGGYLCGLAGAAVGPTIEVALRRPVKLGTTLTLDSGDEGAVLRDDESIVAEARRYSTAFDPPPRVTIAEAEAAAAAYPGLGAHLFPTCFGCGSGRTAGDGLRLFTGPVRESEVVACPWVPDPSLESHGTVAAEIVRAALDCPGIWALMMATPRESTDRAVTGSIAASLLRPIEAGRQYIVIGWPLGRDGRKLYAGAAICSPDGELHAIGKQTMVLTERGMPLDFNRWATPSRA